jgi:hypothetical protein
MQYKGLFNSATIAEDPTYTAICSSKAQYTVEFRDFADSLWAQYEPYADLNYKYEITRDFDSRFWEMYLTCTLLALGLPVKQKSRSAGPDILIEENGKKIWIEATAPSSGDENNTDRVPVHPYGEVFPMPEEQIILRYLSAMEAKYHRYLSYLNEGIVLKDDSYIIAVNGCKIDLAIMETRVPKILKAVFPIGYQQIRISNVTGTIIDTNYAVRAHIEKTSGVKIPTTLFMNPVYRGISAVLYSYSGIGKYDLKLGEDFIFVHNPIASIPVIHGFIKKGTEYIAIEEKDAYRFEVINW